MKILKFFLIILLPTLLIGQTARITLISPAIRGNGSYVSPYLIQSSTIQWRVDQSTASATAQFASEIHMAWHRTCSNVLFPTWESWSTVRGKIYQHSNFCGGYYLKLWVRDGATTVSQELHFFLATPPVLPFVEPYVLPSNNQPPIGRIEIINKIGGDGSWGNRYVIAGPIVYYKVDSSYDPNGLADIQFGALYWAVYMGDKIPHPDYPGPDDQMDPHLTYLYWQDFHGVTLQWDSRYRPSSDNCYDLILVVIDQWGMPGLEATVYLRVDPSAPLPVDNVSPAPPAHLTFKKN